MLPESSVFAIKWINLFSMMIAWTIFQLIEDEKTIKEAVNKQKTQIFNFLFFKFFLIFNSTREVVS